MIRIGLRQNNGGFDSIVLTLRVVFGWPKARRWFEIRRARPRIPYKHCPRSVGFAELRPYLKTVLDIPWLVIEAGGGVFLECREDEGKQSKGRLCRSFPYLSLVEGSKPPKGLSRTSLWNSRLCR